MPLEGKACDEFHRCEPGFACVEGACLSSLPDAGEPRADGGESDDAGEGTGDAGSSDAGSSDAGSVDAGPDDAGSVDAGPADAGPADAGPADAGQSDAGPPRATDGLVALYLFDEGGGDVLHDRSGLAPAIDLTISGTTTWTADGLLCFGEGGLAATSVAPARITNACRAAGAVSLEAWFTPQQFVGGTKHRLVTLPVEGLELSSLPANLPAGALRGLDASYTPLDATSPYALATNLGTLGSSSGEPIPAWPPGEGVTLRVPLATTPGLVGVIGGSAELSGSTVFTVIAPALATQTVGGVDYEVAEGFELDMPVDTSAVSAELTDRMRTLAFPPAGSGYIGQLYVGAGGPSAIYRATGGALAHLGTGDGVTGPDDGMSQMAFSPSDSDYGDSLYLCAASGGGGDGMFRVTDAGGFAVVNGFNNCNGMMFDPSGRYGAAGAATLYANINATSFGQVASDGGLVEYGEVLPFAGSGYRMTGFSGSSAFGEDVLLVDPATGTLWTTPELDTGTPVQRLTGLSEPSSIVPTGGPVFGDAALLSERAAGTVSVLRGDFSRDVVISGLLQPTALATPESDEAEAEVWFLESGRGRILRLRPAAP